MGFVDIGTAARGIRPPGGHGILRQTYEATPLPDGVALVPQRIRPDDSGGSFKEVARLDGGALQAAPLRERGITFVPAQLNVSVITPGTRRFWHVHPTQSELWTIALGQLNAGLVDCREGSPTHGMETKLVLTPDLGVYIPTGVAHGFANESSHVAILHYLVDCQFSDGENTEEWRVSPDQLPFDFVLKETL